MTEVDMNEIVEKYTQFSKEQIKEILSKYMEKKPEPEYFEGQLVLSTITGLCHTLENGFNQQHICPLSILDVWDSVYDRKWKRVAVDEDGRVHAFTNKACIKDIMNEWYCMGQSMTIGQLPSYMLIDGKYPEWKNSLRKARHYKGEE